MNANIFGKRRVNLIKRETTNNNTMDYRMSHTRTHTHTHTHSHTHTHTHTLTYIHVLNYEISGYTNVTVATASTMHIALKIRLVSILKVIAINLVA
jgi:hypothetical protein